MINFDIARRYAAAALKSLEPSKYAEVLSQVHTMKKLFHEHTELLNVFSSPIVSFAKKKELISAITDSLPNKDFWFHFLTTVVMRKRGDSMEQIMLMFEDMLDESLKQLYVTITLAHQQDEQTMALIKAHIEKTLKSRVVYDVLIDKSIIGGFVARTESTIIDASIKSNFMRFAESQG